MIILSDEVSWKQQCNLSFAPFASLEMFICIKCVCPKGSPIHAFLCRDVFNLSLDLMSCAVHQCYAPGGSHWAHNAGCVWMWRKIIAGNVWRQMLALFFCSPSSTSVCVDLSAITVQFCKSLYLLMSVGLWAESTRLSKASLINNPLFHVHQFIHSAKPDPQALWNNKLQFAILYVNV